MTPVSAFPLNLENDSKIEASILSLFLQLNIPRTSTEFGHHTCQLSKDMWAELKNSEVKGDALIPFFFPD